MECQPRYTCDGVLIEGWLTEVLIEGIKRVDRSSNSIKGIDQHLTIEAFIIHHLEYL